MKTFKIVALQISDEQEGKKVPLTDGLIINKESEDGSWIIEAYIKNEYLALFEEKADKDFEIRVIITHLGNDPAPFLVNVTTIHKFLDHFSVLMQGKLSRVRNQYPELLLNDLIKEGYSGDVLLDEFKKRMRLS